MAQNADWLQDSYNVDCSEEDVCVACKRGVSYKRVAKHCIHVDIVAPHVECCDSWQLVEIQF